MQNGALAGHDDQFVLLGGDMNRHFERVDDRFDAFEHRVTRLEKAVFDDPTA